MHKYNCLYCIEVYISKYTTSKNINTNFQQEIVKTKRQYPGNPDHASFVRCKRLDKVNIPPAWIINPSSTYLYHLLPPAYDWRVGKKLHADVTSSPRWCGSISNNKATKMTRKSWLTHDIHNNNQTKKKRPYQLPDTY